MKLQLFLTFLLFTVAHFSLADVVKSSRNIMDCQKIDGGPYATLSDTDKNATKFIVRINYNNNVQFITVQTLKETSFEDIIKIAKHKHTSEKLVTIVDNMVVLFPKKGESDSDYQDRFSKFYSSMCHNWVNEVRDSDVRAYDHNRSSGAIVPPNSNGQNRENTPSANRNLPQ